MGNCNGKVKGSERDPQQPVRSRSELHKLELKRRREEEERVARERKHSGNEVPRHVDVQPEPQSFVEDHQNPQRETSHISQTLEVHRPPPIQNPHSHSGVNVARV